jgi:hypothetical protein
LYLVLLVITGHENFLSVIVLKMRIIRNQLITKKNPFVRDKYPSSIAKNDNINPIMVATPIESISFFITSNFFIDNAIIPKTKVSCVKADPIESPTFMLPCPKKHERIEFIISGKSVPKATRTKPIIIGGTLQLHASAIE